MNGSTNKDSDVTKLLSPTAREFSRSPTASQKIVEQLVSMGYDEDSASRATESAGAVSVEAAVEQLLLQEK
jgi:Holliday junction resolvasome RuvABC DNA-binding subunit